MSGDERDERDRPSPKRDRRELDAIFGDVLPETTSDERDPESSSRDRDAWYRENRPPHHDR
ncbi:hypothetical protein LWP59_34830 [Amycolatopsis acidiphila]|uniref:Uncharacterized protein n=1 Tax=Amycolatopsis acidiphila TaxID=715473 RepID=A0A558A804_9PSEU|nr:hypothetical protein [Amycolatopsis acidiphila]TVT20381.1 hypothetical protein FNH06_20600 [Amycolatopsis acidiphila]UIJ59173.1 hypothetical protein LWP59_34830 [Amycolatopsis acidiphila]GHG78936.1 hypothetical protein GCM10017788_46540 [Amycolatopsis acidiphila]